MALSHSDMVKMIYKSIYKSSWRKILEENPYGIVGDDIWISDPNVAECYCDIMSQWGVTINRSKSIISNRYGEFCGVIFDKDTKMPSYKPKGWRLNLQSMSSSYNYYGKNWFMNI
jgi:hypothetical protein